MGRDGRTRICAHLWRKGNTMTRDELTCIIVKVLDLVAMLEETTKGDMNACSGGIQHTLEAISAELVELLEGVELLGTED